VPETQKAKGPRVGPILLLVAGLVGSRVLGISALLPVLSPYGYTLTDSALLVGLAFGGYGLTMALMQIPMGALSDRYGRRNLLIIGLGLLITGNLIAGSARSIESLILGRLIEGAGAISAVALALATDVLPAAKRTLGLAIAGLAAGSAFLIGIAAGPFLATAFGGVHAIFYVSATLGTLMLLVVLWIVPRGPPDAGTTRTSVLSTLRDPRGLSLDVGSFALYFTLTASLFALPLLWVARPDGTPGPVSEESYRQLLMLAVITGGVVAILLSRVADKLGAAQAFSVIGFLILGGGAAALLQVPPEAVPFLLLGIIGFLYIGAHGILSATLPSLVGAHFPGGARGAAMGGLATAQYLGSFTGGIVGGLLWAHPPALPVVVVLVPVVAAAAVLWSGVRRSGATHRKPGALE
jgi:MFS family permease